MVKLNEEWTVMQKCDWTEDWDLMVRLWKELSKAYLFIFFLVIFLPSG